LDGGDGDQEELDLWLGGFGQDGIELGLLIGRERLGCGDGVESGEACIADGGEVARGCGTFFGQGGFPSQG